jgi:hypothetical protein
MKLQKSKKKKENMQNRNDYKGFSLFNDIEDIELRNRNRAVILTNLMEDNINKKTLKVSMKGADLILNYFNLIPQEERKDVTERFTQGMLQRGFKLIPNEAVSAANVKAT